VSVLTRIRRSAARLLALSVLPALFALSACRSAFVSATLSNHSGGPVSLLEVDYPTASFGRESLPADATFTYRFKILGNGPTKVTWTDAAHHEHTSTGPELHEGQQGQLGIELTPSGASWSPHLAP
jgi:hypothetical protein